MPVKARLPPRWVKRRAWFLHPRVFRPTGGRLGLWEPKPDGWRALRLTTVGRRTGVDRSVILGYLDDGPTLVTVAMNGSEKEEPAWWLNLRWREIDEHLEAYAARRPAETAVVVLEPRPSTEERP